VRKAFPLALALAAFAAAAPAYAAGPLQTAVYVQASDIPSSDSAANLVFKRIRQAGATAVRLTLSWREIAPAQRPADFKAADPGDPAYNWAFADREIKLAVANGLQPLVTVLTAPSWAEEGSHGKGNRKVSPSALGQFATAITTRFSGSFQGLPRVRYWLVWNEPNLSSYLTPQVSGKKLVGATRYRSMVNAFSAAAHTVHGDNIVVAGLVAPFTFRNDPGPLRFMQAVLCMSGGKTPKPTCSARIQFDAWSVHPYTSGGPSHQAFRPSDISLGDLPEARRLLDAAVRARHVASKTSVQFWVTEFSWDSNPPDSRGVPVTLESQWISEGLYRAWAAGISLFTWFLLRDEPRPSAFQSGLYFRNWKPKPALDGFRFPFVAFRQRKGTFVWGRAPGGKPDTVVVERSAKHGWRRVAALRTNQFGIFTRTLSLRLPASAFMRARVSGAKSIAFPLRPPPDRFVTPFGS
jgi:hypothetical protein